MELLEFGSEDKAADKHIGVMQSINSSGPVTAPGVCGGAEDEPDISRLVNPVGGSSPATLNLSLICWLHLLSKESSVDLHGDSANLSVGAPPPPHTLFSSFFKHVSNRSHVMMKTLVG